MIRNRDILSSLLLFFLLFGSLVVSTSPFGIRSTEFDLPEASRDGVTPVVRIHPHRLAKRNGHLDLVTPSKEISFDYQIDQSDLIQTFRWTHDTSFYVNLEDLQTHELIQSDRPVCHGPNEHNKTMIDLHFTDYSVFRNAKDAWKGREDLLFVIEDQSCFEGEGLRSVYRAGEISFEEEPGTLAIRIDAEHKRFGLEETETASDVELSLGSMRQLLKNQTEPFYLTPRHVHTLKPRQFDSLNPVKIGEKLAEHVEDAATLVVDAATSIAEAATSMIGSATAAAVSLATSVTGEVLKEFAKLENGAAMSKNFNIAMHHNIKSVPHVYKGEIETAESRIEITKPITKIISGFPTITFVNSHASIDMDFILRFQTSIAKNLEKKLAGVGDKEKRGIADWISEASLTIEALDAVDIRIQAEVVIPAGAVISCSLSVWPIPGLFGCVPLVLGGPLLVASKAPSTPQPPSGEPGDKHSWFVNTMNKNLEKLPSSFTKQSKYDSSKQVSRLSMEYKNVHGIGMTFDAGIGLWGSFSAMTELNATLPGFHFTMPQGSTASWGIVDGQERHDKFNGNVEWLKPKFNMQNTHFKASLAFGPKMIFNFGGGSSWNSAEIYARVDMPAVEIDVGTKKNVGEDGDEAKEEAKVEAEDSEKSTRKATGLVERAKAVSEKHREEISATFDDALCFWLRVKVGLFAGAGLPGGIQVDTTMFNITGVPGMSGLGMTWNVYSHCWDITDTLLGQFELGLTNGANKKLSSIKGSGYTFEKTGQNDKKPDSGEAGEIKPASEFRTETRSGSKTQSKPTSKHFNDTRAASEYEPYKPSRTTSQAGDSGASITPSPKSPQDYYYAVIKNMALIGLIKTEYVSGGSTWTSTSTSRSTVTDGPWGTVYRAEGDGASIIPSPNSPRVVHQGVVKVVHISGSSTWTSTSTSRSTAIAKPWKTIYRAEGDGASITPSPKFPQMVYYDLVETVHVGGGSTWTSTSTHTATMTGWA